MKKIFLLTLFVFSLSLARAQQELEINAGKLINITEKADFAGLVKLVYSFDYLVLDSSRNKDGSLFYFAKQKKINGNVLACSTDTRTRITELTFNTFSKKDYLILKSQIIKIGFKSSGVHKGNTNEVLESEDFEKGSIIVATAIHKKNAEDFFYEFTFLKF